MIYFQTKPDAVFEAILREALTSEGSEIQLLSDDGAIDSWEGLYPETSRRLPPYTAVRVLAQLLAAVNDAHVYRLTDLHWLVLYESLKNFCAIHNDLLTDFAQHTRPIGEYRLGELDGEALVAIYFWDTDFLLHSDAWDDGESLEACPVESTTENLWDPVIPFLEPVGELGWKVVDADAYFRTGSMQYPDYGET